MTGVAAPLEALDLAVRQAVSARDRWEEALGLRPDVAVAAAEAPLAQHRAVAGQAVFDELGQRVVVSQEIALRDAVRRWVGALTVHRVTEDERAEEARVVAETRLHVHLDVIEMTSYRAGWSGLLGANNLSAGTAWLKALEEGAPKVAAARREREVRAVEVVRRLGYASFAELVGGPPRAKLAPLARTFLEETRDLASALRHEAGGRGEERTVTAEILDARALGAPEGWPGKLTPRALMETLRAPKDLARGVRLSVAMPRVHGAASFALALERFGDAYRRAMAGATREPFSLAVPPWFVDAHRFGFVFGALPSTLAYQRGLGLAARTAARQARMLASTALLHARKAAMAYLLAPSVARPDVTEHEALTAEVFGRPLPPAFAGAFPRMRDVDARLVALFTTLPLLDQLRDQFDEDWFRNPRAWVFLRVRAAGPAVVLAEDDTPEPAMLARAFERALG